MNRTSTSQGVALTAARRSTSDILEANFFTRHGDSPTIMMKLAIVGADGAMGRYISRLAIEDPEINVCLALTEVGSQNVGTDVATLVGRNPIGVKIVDVSGLDQKIKEAGPDVAIDFTVANATEENAKVFVNNGVRMVIGTTGLSASFLKDFENVVKKNKVPALIASNMAVGMNIFIKTVGDVAKALVGWDAEIIEAHHNRKKDAPSGTALTLAGAVASGFGKSLDAVAKYGRPKGPAPRTPGPSEIGIHAVRAGDIVGDHTVLFAGPGERIELVHRAHDRSCFAPGAILAAKFLVKQATGQMYTMQDVLGL
nr:4-hydroxy-tetrahydrodipicolinate reductase [Candidatus Sigynarchaeota archaeon]